MGINASMANVVTPEVANELTSSFTSACRLVIIAFSSHKGREVTEAFVLIQDEWNQRMLQLLEG